MARFHIGVRYGLYTVNARTCRNKDDTHTEEINKLDIKNRMEIIDAITDYWEERDLIPIVA